MKYLVITICCVLVLFAGCNRGDLRVTPVIEGQPALHDGWNIGPGLYLRQGDIAKVTGAVVDIPALDPNELFGD